MMSLQLKSICIGTYAHVHPLLTLAPSISGEYHNISVLLNCWLVDYMQATLMNA